MCEFGIETGAGDEVVADREGGGLSVDRDVNGEVVADGDDWWQGTSESPRVSISPGRSSSATGTNCGEGGGDEGGVDSGESDVGDHRPSS